MTGHFQASSSAPLFAPMRLGPFELAHRVVMAPMTRMRALQPGDVPGELAATYYGQRASQGGLLISEATQISQQGKGFPCTPGIYTSEQVQGWGHVANAVHAKGGRIFVQLWHTGRISHSSHHLNRALPVSASTIRPAGDALGHEFVSYPFETPRALTLEEIDGVVDEYRHAAVSAHLAGVDGVEVHAANGFLIDQFLQERSNQRADRYGGSIDNRMRFLREVVEAVAGVFGETRVGVRISPFGTLGDIGDSQPEALFRSVTAWLSSMRIAYLHVVEPRANAGQTDAPDFSLPVSAAAIFRSQFDGPLIASGGFDKRSAELVIGTGIADAVAFGRMFISNPDLPARFQHDLPLAAYNRQTFYGGNGHGYTDYPEHAATVA